MVNELFVWGINMFILMGEKEKLLPVVRGTFDCKFCQSEQHYSHHQSMAYFTLFGIPIAKLNLLSNYLSCDECSACYSADILTDPQGTYPAIDHQLLFRILCYLLSGYGDTIQSRQRVISIYRMVTGQIKEQQDIDQEIAIIDSGNSPTLPLLVKHDHQLSPAKKQQLVVAAYQFAAGSCLMEHHDRVRINTIGSSLGLSLPEIEYLIVNNQE